MCHSILMRSSINCEMINNHRCFRSWLGTCSVPSHHLKHWRFFLCLTWRILHENINARQIFNFSRTHMGNVHCFGAIFVHDILGHSHSFYRSHNYAWQPTEVWFPHWCGVNMVMTWNLILHYTFDYLINTGVCKIPPYIISWKTSRM